MIVRTPLIAVLALALGARAPAALSSSWDETQLQLLEQYSMPLRWYNVEGAPYRVSGAEPHYDFFRRLHFVHLQPSQEIILRASADTWLRVAGKTTALRPEDLQVSVSTDARAFAVATPLHTSAPEALWIELPHDTPSLIRIARQLDQ